MSPSCCPDQIAVLEEDRANGSFVRSFVRSSIHCQTGKHNDTSPDTLVLLKHSPSGIGFRCEDAVVEPQYFSVL